MFTRIAVLSLMFAGFAASAQAEFTKVENQEDFIRIVQGKTLKRPFVNLTVSPDGRISGKGARWAVTGSWTWKNGYFCRDLYWGGDELGYNCQEVRTNSGRLRFTSDEGAGQSAVFNLE